MNKNETARELAHSSLLAIERDGKYSNIEVDTVLERSRLNDADRGLYTRLVYGVTERRITLDYIIGKYSRLPVRELDPDVLTAVRMGIYQLAMSDRIPAHAAVDSSVELVSRAKSGYVNAVLRSFLRGGMPDLPSKDDFRRYLSVKESVPEELAAHFISVYGDESEALLDAMNAPRGVGLRVNTLKTDTAEVCRITGGTVSAIVPDVILVPNINDAVREGITNGLWFVQDEASAAAAASLGAKPGETVVDTCACPGGKSFGCAIDMKDRGRIYSFDLHKNKLSLINEGASRLGIGIIETSARDARKPDEKLIGRADRVICDAPCSGLGVIAKKPEIRYKNLDDIKNLPAVQKAVLDGASEYVKPGGRLVYSTCTLNPAENEDVVEYFLETHPGFTTEGSEPIKTFLPHKDGCDGFFRAVLRKKDE